MAAHRHPEVLAPDDYAGLVAAVKAGDEQAMERLLMRAQEVAWRFSLSVCGHAEDAEDAMQEALIKTYRHAGQIRDSAAFRPWLYRTVRNACLIGRRKKVHEPRHVESLDAPIGNGADAPQRDPRDPGRNPEQVAAGTERQQQIRRALQALPGMHRAVLFLREVEGLSTREVAKVLEISEDNVKTRLHRARVALQKNLAGADRALKDQPLRGAARRRASQRVKTLLGVQDKIDAHQHAGTRQQKGD
jgi:RNA polymerase sigma-70 factor (ECF subfamily)